MSSETASQTSQTLKSEMNTPSVGRVKWFNNKAGYGFITIMNTSQETGPSKGTDIFVHHSSINVENEQYKYLVQGEYVEFQIIHTTESEHEYQAGNITGILNGKLMCETIRDIKTNKIQYRQNQSQNISVLDAQQALSLPVLNTTSSEDTKDFIPVRKSRGRKPQVVVPSTPSTQKRTKRPSAYSA